jgi:hypothetical protein
MVNLAIRSWSMRATAFAAAAAACLMRTPPPRGARAERVYCCCPEPRMAHFKKAYSQHSVVFFQSNRNGTWLLVEPDVNQEPVLFSSAPALYHAAGKEARGSGCGDASVGQRNSSHLQPSIPFFILVCGSMCKLGVSCILALKAASPQSPHTRALLTSLLPRHLKRHPLPSPTRQLLKKLASLSAGA